ncbi:uncharacterized protein [Taeniopygia guttata]|uniref:uncharacterized protein isoform X6 n=1 Tax=Taeniopygia guttata TaxID=59729 RepID=UPI003BB88B1B
MDVWAESAPRHGRLTPGLPGALGRFEPRADVPRLTPRNGDVIAGGSAARSPAGALREPQPRPDGPGLRVPPAAGAGSPQPHGPEAAAVPAAPGFAAAKSVTDAEVRREVGTAGRRGGHRTPGEAEVTAAVPRSTGGMRGRAEFSSRPDPAPSLAGTRTGTGTGSVIGNVIGIGIGNGTEDPEPWEEPKPPNSRLAGTGIPCPGIWERLFGVCSGPVPMGPSGRRLRVPEDPRSWTGTPAISRQKDQEMPLNS